MSMRTGGPGGSCCFAVLCLLFVVLAVVCCELGKMASKYIYKEAQLANEWELDRKVGSCFVVLYVVCSMLLCSGKSCARSLLYGGGWFSLFVASCCLPLPYLVSYFTSFSFWCSFSLFWLLFLLFIFFHFFSFLFLPSSFLSFLLFSINFQTT